MKKILLIIIFFLLSVSSVQALSSQAILDETNKYREKHDLEPLVWNEDLAYAAQLKAKCIVLYDDFAHEPRDYYGNVKCTVDKLLAHVEYPWSSYGENLAMGSFDSAEELVTAWYNSPGHRANLLSKNHTELGVGGIENAYFLGKEVNIYVQEFGSPGENIYVEREPDEDLKGITVKAPEEDHSTEPLKYTKWVQFKQFIKRLTFWR